MADLKIEGDLTQINDRQLEFIKSVIEKRGFKNNKVTVVPVGKVGDNYVANVKRITVEDGDKGALKMVVKIAPQHPMQREMGNTEGLFRNETIMYTRVLPKYTQLEKSYDVPPQDRLKYAICYGALTEAPNEVIILEDLKESNFVMLDRFKSLSSDCVKSVLRNFALIHSLSYALKYKEPEIYEELKDSFFDVWSTVKAVEEAEAFFEQVETNAVSILENDVHKKAVKGAVVGAMHSLAKFSNSDRNSKHSVIQQGDAWTNNIMFNFDGDNLQESIMIDYQISKPGNPVVDILYMICNCTDYKSRKEHFYDWIDYYHTELDKALSYYGLKANYIYPKDQLDVDLKRYGKASFGQSVMLTGILTLKPEEAAMVKTAMENADMDDLMKNTSGPSKDPETVAIFKNKIEGLIDSFREFGLI